MILRTKTVQQLQVVGDRPRLRDTRAKITKLLTVVSLLLSTVSCNRARPVQSFLEEPFPEKLSQWNFFIGAAPELRANKGVLPYDLNTPLFSDYASKYRFVWMPPGTSAQYRQDQVFDFPVGAVLIKTFAFPRDGKEKLIETRLLINTAKGWVGLPYVWNDRQSEATLQMVPDPVPVSYSDAAGKKHEFTYFIPNANECKQCHENARVMLPIGPKARNLNRDYSYADGAANQLARWTAAGYLSGAPAPGSAPKAAEWNQPQTGSVEQRARAYLDSNCAHCHQPGGSAGYTGFDLRLSADAASLGVCKSPNSAGRVGTLIYDLVPGHAEQSILLARMESTRPKEMMPQIGRSVTHEEGVDLVRDWINSMPISVAPCAQP